MTKALIPKQGGNLANRSLKAGWSAPVCRAVAAYGRAVAQQAAAGRGVNKFWGDVAPAGAMAVQAAQKVRRPGSEATPWPSLT